ncbi:MAG TPA: GFA family protein [Geminicoccaceae bacterium]|nr:GFA family protein [Geminicoccaceae bacterium]
MRLEGSCHCGAVRFSVESHTPHPYMRCHCSVCRKTAGGGGYAINIMGDAATLKVEGGESVTVYRAVIDGQRSPMERRFCKVCGSALWGWDPRWPELVHPFASAIDTPLPKPPERVHLMLDYAAPWVEVPSGPTETRFPEYPEESIEGWHRARGLWVE